MEQFEELCARTGADQASYSASYPAGGRDAQVTSTELELWKETLSGLSDTSYKLYPELNHAYIESGKGDPMYEFLVPGNVPTYVIDDLESWIKSH